MSQSSTLKSKDIARMMQNGRPVRSRSFLVFLEPLSDEDSDGRSTSCEAEPGKIAFIAPKRLGNAVLRNKYKRLLRAAFDHAVKTSESHYICDKNNIIFMAGNRLAGQDFYDIANEMSEIFARVAEKSTSSCDSKTSKRNTL
ncbi:MAG: ribonuclease P protein component [Coriobacteriia bacterium]|nr:ribonuclease P protein component [Coriobacteriia bacterium]